MSIDLKSKLRHVMDFPKGGIDFIDITTVLQNPASLKQCIDSMAKTLLDFGEFDLIVGPEARGFIFGVPLAYVSGTGFAPIRKAGKLPYKSVRAEYACEYHTSVLEIHEDAVLPGQKVVIVDDLLATGGTTRTNIELVQQLGGEIVGILYLVELSYLGGRSMLTPYIDDRLISSIIKFG